MKLPNNTALLLAGAGGLACFGAIFISPSIRIAPPPAI